MPKKERWKVDAVRRAIYLANGVQSRAAEILGMASRSTMTVFINRHPSLRKDVTAATEQMLDFAENKLHKQIEKGNMTAIIFFLKCQGKERGYIERQEHDIRNLTLDITEDAPEDFNG